MLQTEETCVPGTTKDRLLKPSEAMRIGAALRPQCTERLFWDGRSCAWGAMLEGYGIPYGSKDITPSYIWDMLPEYFNSRELFDLNDKGWTREQIADWLEAQGS